MEPINRRDFMKAAAASAAGYAMNKSLPKSFAEGADSNRPVLPRRDYGKTGERLSIIGFGSIVVMNAEQQHANHVVAEAVERGVNYFDVAPSYGNTEEILGPALEPFRKKCFLACKTTQRTREGAEKELENSLKRLRTDYFDLYQVHGITDVKKDVDAAFAKGGAMEVFLEARKSGRIRFIGFSAHTTEAALAAMERFEFTSVLFPLNLACYHKGNFGRQILERAKEKGIARLALKMLARQKWPKDDSQKGKYPKCWYQPFTDPAEAELALRFTLSQPITAAVTPGEESLFRIALDLAMNFKPLTPEEEEKVKAIASTLDPIFQIA